MAAVGHRPSAPREAGLLILDDATVSLDRVTEGRIVEALRDRAPATVFMCTSRPGVTELADLVLGLVVHGEAADDHAAGAESLAVAS